MSTDSTKNEEYLYYAKLDKVTNDIKCWMDRYILYYGQNTDLPISTACPPAEVAPLAGILKFIGLRRFNLDLYGLKFVPGVGITLKDESITPEFRDKVEMALTGKPYSDNQLTLFFENDIIKCRTCALCAHYIQNCSNCDLVKAHIHPDTAADLIALDTARERKAMPIQQCDHNMSPWRMLSNLFKEFEDELLKEEAEIIYDMRIERMIMSLIRAFRYRLDQPHYSIDKSVQCSVRTYYKTCSSASALLDRVSDEYYKWGSVPAHVCILNNAFKLD